MLIYLKPLSIFPELHSDTLFGAITYAISELYPEKIDEMIESFKSEPPFIISSTFPFIFNNTRKIKFYPKIIFPHKSKDLDEKFLPKDFKDYKKVKFIEEGLFFDLLKGKLNESDILRNYNQYNSVKGLLMRNSDDIDFNFGENIIPNNSVNRITNETEGIFYTSGNEFRNMGLFFLVEFANEEYRPIIKAAMKFLKDRGFGRDISTGKGHFDYSIEDEYSINQYDGNYFVTLSRFIPNSDDLAHINEFASYEIDSKRGKSSSNEIRKQVRFFKEGSVFPDYKKYYGQIVQSGKVNPAIEYGFAFPLKCRLEEEE